MTTWPITLEGYLHPAKGKIDQYEFGRCDSNAIAKLPLPPYEVTASSTLEQRNPGIQITCQFGANTVQGQFHRTEADKMWIGTNRRSIEGPPATRRWHHFVSFFGIKVCVDDKEIPVYLDFYPDLRVVIRLQCPSS
jgi:hypothetical protein